MLPATRLAVTVFNFTKPLEFFDTFLHSALKGKEPSFLHAFHHIATAIAAWCSLAGNARVSHYPAFMNLFVHTIMYSYFSAVSLHPTLKRTFRPLRLPITFIQVVQMFMGTAYCIIVLIANGPSPHDVASDIDWCCACYALLMYGCYIRLFGGFFLREYCPTKRIQIGEAEMSSVLPQKHL